METALESGESTTEISLWGFATQFQNRGSQLTSEIDQGLKIVILCNVY